MLPECLLDEDAPIQVVRANWTEADLLLDIRLLSDDSPWRITCTGASHWCLQDRFADGLQLSEDDPVLWQSQSAIYTAYFKGEPIDPYRATCGLLSALPRPSGVLVLKPDDVVRLLQTGNGCFGPMPVPAIRRCQAVLVDHAVEVYYLGPDHSNATGAAAALFFGNNSHVVAEGFDAERLSGE